LAVAAHKTNMFGFIKVLDLYIAKKFLTTVFFMLIATSVIAVVFDISEKIDNILEHHLTFWTVLQYYMNFIPGIANRVSQFIIFLSALYFTSRMANQTEIIPVLASGISYYRLLAPYIFVGLLITGGDMYLKNYVLPHSLKAVTNFEDLYVVTGGESHSNYHIQIDKNTQFYVGTFNNDNRAFRFSIEKFDDNKNLVYELNANNALFDTTKKVWRLQQYHVRTIDGMHETLKFGDSMYLKIPITNKDFSAKERSLPGMTTPELNRFIAAEKIKGEDVFGSAYVEKYRRVSVPFANLIFIMIAVAISTRKVRGGMGIHLVLGIFIGFTYEIVMQFSTTFSIKSDFPPLLSVWLPNILYAGLAAYLLKTTPK